MTTNRKKGCIILVNGASSSGKSTICAELQAKLPEPFWHISIDHLRDAKVLPAQRLARGDFKWADMRPAFFDGFHRCLAALAAAGNNLIVEYIIETAAAHRQLIALLAPYDVFFVGIHCPVAELERREQARGDRPIGDARRDFVTVHSFGPYDCEVDSTQPAAQNADRLIATWKIRRSPGAWPKRVGAVPIDSGDRE